MIALALWLWKYKHKNTFWSQLEKLITTVSLFGYNATCRWSGHLYVVQSQGSVHTVPFSFHRVISIWAAPNTNRQSSTCLDTHTHTRGPDCGKSMRLDHVVSTLLPAVICVSPPSDSSEDASLRFLLTSVCCYTLYFRLTRRSVWLFDNTVCLYSDELPIAAINCRLWSPYVAQGLAFPSLSRLQDFKACVLYNRQ